MTATATTTDRAEIDFSVYDPYSLDFARDPWPTWERLLDEFPVAYHRDLRCWMVSPHDLASEVMKSPRFSTNFSDYKDCPPPKPRSEWNLYNEVMQHHLQTQTADGHMRLRRLTAPAFSRKVMDLIEHRIRDSVVGVFDEIADPRRFDVADDIAAKVPIRAIARMVGVPSDADTLFEHGLGWNLVRAANPLYSPEERARFQEGTIPGLQFLIETVQEARRGGHTDDFIGTLIDTEVDGERLHDLEIVALLISLVSAGADTAVDLHTTAVQAFLDHPDQWALLGERPDLHEAAVIEALRWGSMGKLGAIPRFPREDVEIAGQVLGKGEFVYFMLGPSWVDPRKWPEPRRFDITRNHAGNIVFGAGPHLCIGLNLVKVQGRLVLEEWRRRFGDTARLAGEIEYDPQHWNARRISRMPVETGA